MIEKKNVKNGSTVFLSVLCIVLLASTVGTVIYYSTTFNNYSSTHSRLDSEYAVLMSQIAVANSNISSLNLQLSTLQTEFAANNSQIVDLNKQITNLNAQIKNADENVKKLEDYYNSKMYVLNTDNHDLSVELTTANTELTSLQNQVNALNAICNLTVSTTWVNNQTVSQQAGRATTWLEPATYAGYVAIQVFSSTINSIYANVSYSSYGVNYTNQMNLGNGIAYFPILPSNVTVAIGNSLLSGIATETVTITYFY